MKPSALPGTAMLISVKLNPALTQLYGGHATGIMLMMPPPSAIADLRAMITEGASDETAALTAITQSTFTVNQEEASDDWHLRELDEVEVIPLVSGG